LGVALDESAIHEQEDYRLQVREKTPWGWRYAGGREVCDLLHKAGRDEYMGRIRTMWLRQKKRCCLEGCVEGCPGVLRIAEATFEHQDGRGMDGGHRDDRIEKPDAETGQMQPYNGAAHAWCNNRKGSVRMKYNGVELADVP
jgi:hypothetical protein